MDLINKIQKELKALADPKIATHSMTFFKTGKGEYGEGDQFLGIRVPVLRKLSKKYTTITVQEASDLLKSPFHEQRLLALFMLVNLFNNTDIKIKENIFKVYISHTRYINNWDLVDSSAHYIVGAYLCDKDKKLLYDFSYSSDLWERRIAILSTYFFIKKNEFQDTLNISNILLTDKEDLIHKAVGWMLREVGKRDINIEEVFLNAHCKTMPRTMLRYAIEKFPEALRQQYLKG